MSGRFDTRQIVRGGTRPKAEDLLARVGETVAAEQAVVERQLRRNDVTVIRGEAYFVDPHTIGIHVPNAEGKMTAEYVFVGVGTQPAKPPGIEADGETVMTSDDVPKMKVVPRSLAVVGAGVIGTEYASMFAQLGTEVTVIEKRERPLEFLDREIVDELMHQMRDRNVTFRLEESVASIRVEEKNGAKRAVIELESGKRIISDAALFSAGRVASTENLHLGVAGVPIGERGRLKVDEHFRTSVTHIYAGGDVIGAPALAATSAEQGRRAACHMFGVSAEPMPSWYPFGIYSIPEISTVGENEEQLTEKKVPYEIGVARYREIARGEILGDNSGLFKMLFHRDTRKLLGIHIIGTQATELVHIGQAVLALGGGLDYFLDAVFNYPTLAECYKVAALDAANKLSA